MTTEDVLELRKQGRTEEAYKASRQIYATDKGPQATACMFWTALDRLHQLTDAQQTYEAQRIYLALERVLTRMSDRDGRARASLNQAKRQLDSITNHTTRELLSTRTLQGRWGEEQAADYLRRAGYVIMEHDWHSRHRDIDLVALDGETVVFVEVKTRSSANFGSPEEAIGYNKQRNLRLAINHYLHYQHTDRPWRFDVITVVGTKGTQPTINHIKDFALSMR